MPRPSEHEYRSPYSRVQPEPLSVKKCRSLRASKSLSDAKLPSITTKSRNESLPKFDPLDVSSPSKKRLDYISYLYSPKSINPFGLAVRETSVARSRLLLPPPPQTTSRRGDLLVDACMEKKGFELLEVLLDKDTSINRPPVDAVHSIHGLTPLMGACKFGFAQTVRALVYRGANPNITRKLTHDTALHFAAKSGSVLSVKILLDAGAVQVRDRRGCTPLDYAKERPDSHALISMLWSVPNQPGPVSIFKLNKADDTISTEMENPFDEYDIDEYTIDSTQYGSGDVKITCSTDASDALLSLKLVWKEPNANGTTINLSEIAWLLLTEDQVESEKNSLHGVQDNKTLKYNTCKIPGSKCQALLKGLLPCRWYKIMVRSKNTIGWGLYSQPSLIWSGSSVPEGMDPPLIVRQTSSTLQLEWKQPRFTNGEPIDRYEIEVKFRSSEKTEENMAEESCWHMYRRVTPLLGYEVPVEGTDTFHKKYWYVFRVRACNINGWSAFSSPSAGCETLDFSKAEVMGATTVRVTWSKVLGASKYQIQAANATPHDELLSSQNLKWKVVCESISITSDMENANSRPSRVLSGLTPSSIYTFRVLDYHEMFGWSIGARSEPVKTNPDVPATPCPPVLVNATPQALNVVSKMPKNNGQHATAPPRPVVTATTQTTVSLEFRDTEYNGGDYGLSTLEIARRLGEYRNTSASHDRQTKHTIRSRNRLLEWTVVGKVKIEQSKKDSYTFTDNLLVPGSSYDYAVRVINTVGPSPWSEPSGPVSTLGKEPSRPSAPVLKEGGRYRNFLNIEWLPPVGVSKRNENLDYDIEQVYIELEDIEFNQTDLRKWHKAKFHCEAELDPGQIPWAHVTNILPGACLKFRVRAKNAFGTSPWGDESIGIKSGVTVPDPVAPPNIDYQGEREIGVSWRRPPCRGSRVTMYELSRLTIGKNFDTIGEWEVELRTASLHYVVPNLKPATSLCFRVRAYNENGWGPYGYACDNTRTLSTIPSTPSPPTMLSWNPHNLKILISWGHRASAIDNGIDNGASIQRYEVQRLGFTEGSKWEDIGITSGADRFIELSEPVPVCLKRWFRVRCVNKHGNSQWSEKSGEIICRPLN